MHMRKYNAYFKIEYNKSAETENIKPINDELLDVFQNAKADFDYQYRDIRLTDKDYPQYCPIELNPTYQKDIIYIAMSDCSLWNQLVYQLSHELTHCFVHCHNKNLKQEIKWFEETICEAMSLYFLDHFSKKWCFLPVSVKNRNYAKKFIIYAQNVINGPSIISIENIKTEQELQLFNIRCEKERANRRREMICLYKKITKSCILGLLAYRDYVIEGTLMLDTQKYRNDFPGNVAVDYICSLQDGIMANIISNAA